MKNNYTVVFTSLGGVLNNESLSYEGVRRPPELMRILDAPRHRVDYARSEEEQKMLARYFTDLYEVFMKKLSAFVVEAEADSADTVKIQALLQEMIKVKQLISKSK